MFSFKDDLCPLPLSTQFPKLFVMICAKNEWKNSSIENLSLFKWMKTFVSICCSGLK